MTLIVIKYNEMLVRDDVTKFCFIFILLESLQCLTVEDEKDEIYWKSFSTFMNVDLAGCIGWMYIFLLCFSAHPSYGWSKVLKVYWDEKSGDELDVRFRLLSRTSFFAKLSLYQTVGVTVNKFWYSCGEMWLGSVS